MATGQKPHEQVRFTICAKSGRPRLGWRGCRSKWGRRREPVITNGIHTRCRRQPGPKTQCGHAAIALSRSRTERGQSSFIYGEFTRFDGQPLGRRAAFFQRFQRCQQWFERSQRQQSRRVQPKRWRGRRAWRRRTRRWRRRRPSLDSSKQVKIKKRSTNLFKQ